jgi:hypothetical protein
MLVEWTIAKKPAKQPVFLYKTKIIFDWDEGRETRTED